MGIPAAPEYANEHMGEDMPPGHRFELFFPVWDGTKWEMEANKKGEALKKALPLGKIPRDMLAALVAKQECQAALCGENIFSVSARSSAPFLTGTGIEHPLENGFSFLKPYGLPYLPGSGVKGVLRKACEELALQEASINTDWDIVFVWRLFGFESGSAYLTGQAGKGGQVHVQQASMLKQRFLDWVRGADFSGHRAFLGELIKQGASGPDESAAYAEEPARFLIDLVEKKDLRDRVHTRGALLFWDVFPEPPGQGLSMDILTPHYGHYYREGRPPHDSGSPNPNFFLTLRQGSAFRFHVQYMPGADAGAGRNGLWKQVLKDAFSYAFDWLGFGAKTSAGYGQMNSTHSSLGGEVTEPGASKGEPVAGEPETARETWAGAHLVWSPGDATLTASWEGKKAHGRGKALIPDSILKKLSKKKSAKGNVVVEPIGNSFKIVEVKE